MPTRLINLRKSAITAHALKKATATPKAKRFQRTASSDCIRETALKQPAAAIMGIAMRKENRAAASRDNPSINPAVIVMPERDVPGIKASA